MELKYLFNVAGFVSLESSNRTFMELKSDKRSLTDNFINVLIAPLWN